MHPQIARPDTIRRSLRMANDDRTRKILLWVSRNNEPCEAVIVFNRNERFGPLFETRRREMIDKI